MHFTPEQLLSIVKKTYEDHKVFGSPGYNEIASLIQKHATTGEILLKKVNEKWQHTDNECITVIEDLALSTLHAFEKAQFLVIAEQQGAVSQRLSLSLIGVNTIRIIWT